MDKGNGLPKVLYEDCNERLRVFPRLAEMMVEKAVNLRNMASCLVVSSCIVHTTLHMQSFFAKTFFVGAM